MYQSLVVVISIHPPRAGRDVVVAHHHLVVAISIHPPRAGRDGGVAVILKGVALFQSTLPVRGGTQINRRST